MIEVRVFATLRQGRDKVTMLPPEGITNAADILHLQLNQTIINQDSGSHRYIILQIRIGNGRLLIRSQQLLGG